jgi:hypothetical protein
MTVAIEFDVTIVCATKACTWVGAPVRVRATSARNAEGHKRAELLELARAGADVPHGAEVRSKVADIRAVGIDISLLTDHDVIDQAGSPGIFRREPWDLDTGHVLLKALPQRHEIPDRKNVIFHKAAEIGDGSNLRVNRTVEQRGAKAAKMVIVVFRHA